MDKLEKLGQWYWSHYTDAGIPLAERVLVGATLPAGIVATVAIGLLGTTGCAGKEEEYKGPDCEPDAHTKDNFVTVGPEGQCTTLEYAKETLDPTKVAVIQLSSGNTTGTVTFNEDWEDLTIKPADSAESPSVLTPRDLSETGECIITVDGNSTVTIDGGERKEDGTAGLKLEGLGQYSGVCLKNGAYLIMDNTDVHDVVDGVSAEASVFDGDANDFSIVYNSAIYAGSEAVMASDHTRIRGVVNSAGPAIDAEEGSSAHVAFRGGSISEWTSAGPITRFEADDVQLVGNEFFNNEGETVISLNGGQAYESTDPLVEGPHRIENNVIVNNFLFNSSDTGDSPAVIRADASGEISAANNTVAYNEVVTYSSNGSSASSPILDFSDQHGIGTTGWKNNLVVGNRGVDSVILGAESVDSHGDPLVVDEYNSYYENDGAPADIDEELNHNLECTPVFAGVGEYMFIPAESYLSPIHFQPEEEDACVTGNGDPTGDHHNPGEDEADRGAFGGLRVNYLFESIDMMNSFNDWFGISE